MTNSTKTATTLATWNNVPALPKGWMVRGTVSTDEAAEWIDNISKKFDHRALAKQLDDAGSNVARIVVRSGSHPLVTLVQRLPIELGRGCWALLQARGPAAAFDDALAVLNRWVECMSRHPLSQPE